MAGHHAEHARQTATLRWVALGILIPNTFFIEAALGRFARCRYSAIQNNVQTNTYDPRRHGATPSLLSCYRSVDDLRPACPALSFAKLRSDKNQAKRPGSSLHANSSQPVCRLFRSRTCVMLARSTEVRTQELRRLCPLLSDRTQEGDKQAALDRPWLCPVLWTSDERADIAISTRMIQFCPSV